MAAMKTTLMALLAFGVCLPLAGADKDKRLPKLSAECAKVRGLVLPNPSEASIRMIPWRTSVLQGLVEAQKNDKPVMIYLMNGHPLGCT